MASEYSVNIKLNTQQVKRDLKTIGTEISNLGRKTTGSKKRILKLRENLSRLGFNPEIKNLNALNFDEKIIGSEFLRIHGKNPLQDFPRIDTCTEETATLCQLSGGRGRKYKLPTLTELHINLFGKEFDSAHNLSLIHISEPTRPY